MHDQYVPARPGEPPQNDIALIEIDGTVPTDIVPLPMMTALVEGRILGAREDATVIGWGKNAFSAFGKTSDHLHWTTVKLVQNPACNEPVRYSGHITERQLCAGNDFADLRLLVAPEIRAKALRLSWTVAPSNGIALAAAPVRQIALNLLLNACDAISANSEAERRVEIRAEAIGGGVRVSVADRGHGIAPEVMGSLFKPFLTTKAHGLGLGLSVCRSIIAAHGGELGATNGPRRGAVFAFSLPAVEPGARRQASIRARIPLETP